MREIRDWNYLRQIPPNNHLAHLYRGCHPAMPQYVLGIFDRFPLTVLYSPYYHYVTAGMRQRISAQILGSC
jgi:hypothetical protein